MTDQTGAVYDLGYEPYEGERNGRSGARRTVVADGLRRVLGLRRKGRRKVLPWALLVVAIAPAVVASGMSFLFPPGAPQEIGIVTANAEFFLLGGTIALLFTSLAAPELLIPDRSDGVLSMLASRPLTPADYIVAKFASITAIVGAFLLVPQLFLYIGGAGTYPEGPVRRPRGWRRQASEDPPCRRRLHDCFRPARLRDLCPRKTQSSRIVHLHRHNACSEHGRRDDRTRKRFRCWALDRTSFAD